MCLIFKLYIWICMTLLTLQFRHKLTQQQSSPYTKIRPPNLSTVYINLMDCNWANGICRSKFRSCSSDNLITMTINGSNFCSISIILLFSIVLLVSAIALELDGIVAMAPLRQNKTKQNENNNNKKLSVKFLLDDVRGLTWANVYICVHKHSDRESKLFALKVSQRCLDRASSICMDGSLNNQNQRKME